MKISLNAENQIELHAATKLSNYRYFPIRYYLTVRNELIKMVISPASRQINARESHSNLKLPDAKQKIQGEREQRALVQFNQKLFFSEADSVT